ncbi:pilin [Lysobacter arvi]|uniref:Pilin n=1 Tax=Lysobacter arvi TaxID=3038776 RepID=A0ABU1CF00_9GAMM|nr:pilin [Lysobacter arvi]MDR0183525.1 pilin [Lysobacter arvi]
MKKQQGFTLIELMIVVAIVAILAAIALPAYQDYMKRSKVSEAVATAGACKTSVAEYVAATTKLPVDIDAAGCSNVQSQYVDTVDVTNGVISIKMRGVGTGVDTKVLKLAPQQVGDNITGWTCSTDADKKFVPGSCRG